VGVVFGTLPETTGLKPLSGLKDNRMKIHNHLLIASIVLAFSAGTATAQNTHT
jgi:hypothetical protein